MQLVQRYTGGVGTIGSNRVAPSSLNEGTRQEEARRRMDLTGSVGGDVQVCECNYKRGAVQGFRI
jgi:hypothetical protein